MKLQLPFSLRKAGLGRVSVPDHAVTIRGFGELTQIAIITENASQTIQDLNHALRAGSFKVFDLNTPELFNRQYRGEDEPWTMRLGVSWVGDMMVEVIQPTGGRSVYADYLANRGGRTGIEHIYLDRSGVSYPEAKSILEKAGYPLAQEASLNAGGRLGWVPMPALPHFAAHSYGARFGYTSTRDTLKIDIEVAKFPPGVWQRLALRAAVPSEWIPNDDRDDFESLPYDAVLRDIDMVYVLANDFDSLVSHYAKLTVRPPQVERFEDDHLPGRGRMARIRGGSCLLGLVGPERGVLTELLTDAGEGITLVRGRPMRDLTSAREALDSRGWRVEQFEARGIRKAPGVYATHERVPFALWMVTSEV